MVDSDKKLNEPTKIRVRMVAECGNKVILASMWVGSQGDFFSLINNLSMTGKIQWNYWREVKPSADEAKN